MEEYPPRNVAHERPPAVTAPPTAAGGGELVESAVTVKCVELMDNSDLGDYCLAMLFLFICFAFVLWCAGELRSRKMDVSALDPLLALFFTAAGVGRVLYEKRKCATMSYTNRLMEPFSNFIIAEYFVIFGSFVTTYTLYMYKYTRISLRMRLQMAILIRLLSRRVCLYITATVYNLNLYTFSDVTPSDKSVIILCVYISMYVLLMVSLSEILDGTLNVFTEFTAEAFSLSVAILFLHYGYTYINDFHTFNSSVVTFSACLYMVSKILVAS
ncbi:protein E13 [Elephant endotheliotropic herpesvirus 3B]|nr:protein E13 [Elephant endotheliotropic herpesvirus 3B]